MDGADKDPMADLLAAIVKAGGALDGAPVTAENVTQYVSTVLGVVRQRDAEVTQLNITIDVLAKRVAARK